MNPNDAISRLFDLKEFLRDTRYVTNEDLDAIDAGINALLKIKTPE